MNKYSLDQKKNALKMLAEIGPYKTHAETGIPATTLYRWKKVLGENMNETADLEEVMSEDELPVCVEAAEDESRATEAPTQEPEMDSVNEKLIQALLAENEKLTLTNARLRRENDQFRRTLLVLLER